MQGSMLTSGTAFFMQSFWYAARTVFGKQARAAPFDAIAFDRAATICRFHLNFHLSQSYSMVKAGLMKLQGVDPRGASRTPLELDPR